MEKLGEICSVKRKSNLINTTTKGKEFSDTCKRLYGVMVIQQQN